jgi:anti-sigma-K factor RskA
VLKKTIAGWVAELESRKGESAQVAALLELWRRSVVEERLQGEARSRYQLPHALKAAEHAYHRHISLASAAVAVLEGIAICLYVGVPTGSLLGFALVVMIPAGILGTLSRAVNALIELVIAAVGRLSN